MVLIGVKGSGNDRIFLLQNWWKKKQFIQVSVDYLTACLPAIYFVKTAQTEIPFRFPAKLANFCESVDSSFEGCGNEDAENHGSESYDSEGGCSDDKERVGLQLT